MNGGFGMRYEVLRQFACRDGAVPMRLNAYVSFDPALRRNRLRLPHRNIAFHAALRDRL